MSSKKRRAAEKLSDKKHKKRSKKDGSGDEWVEADVTDLNALVGEQKRDDWMTTPFVASTIDSRASTSFSCNDSSDVPANFLDKPGQHPKELNPYWKDGGTGLPSESKGNSPQGKLEGRSWLLRAYKRALEQAKEMNVSFDVVAKKRWGSVEKIYSLLQSAGIDPVNPDNMFSRSFLYSRSKHEQCISSEYPSSSDSTFKINLSKGVSKSFLRPGDDSSANMYSYNQLLSGDSSRQAWQVEQLNKTSPQLKSSTRQEVSDTPGAQNEILVTEAMINEASAKFIKAELVGNTEKMKKFKLELDRLRSKKKIQDSQRFQSQSESVSKEKTVLLTDTDQFGNVRPAEIHNSTPDYTHSRKKKSKRKDTGDCSLKSLMEEERKLTAEDTLEAITKMASKFVRSNAEDVVDDVLDRNVDSDPRGKTKLQVLTESRKMEESVEKCKYCLSSSHFKSHLLIAMGINAYLCAPFYQSLTEGHCLIVPLQHSPCLLQLDENVVSEIKIFQKGLTKMFSDNDMDAIFTECYMSSDRRFHMCIECIPVRKSEGSMAPMYFKKAILESDAEWAQNKRLIDTRSKELRKCLPLGLPYFFVDFNNEGGFAHVIEDSSLFPRYFAKEIIGGLIDVEPRLWLKPQHESTEQQRLKASKISDMWKQYDWTKKLNH